MYRMGCYKRHFQLSMFKRNIIWETRLRLSGEQIKNCLYMCPQRDSNHRDRVMQIMKQALYHQATAAGSYPIHPIFVLTWIGLVCHWLLHSVHEQKFWDFWNVSHDIPLKWSFVKEFLFTMIHFQTVVNVTHQICANMWACCLIMCLVLT